MINRTATRQAHIQATFTCRVVTNERNEQMSRHAIEVPDPLWEFFQQISGQRLPGNTIRDALWQYRLDYERQDRYNTAAAELSAVAERNQVLLSVAARREKLGLQHVQFDQQFANAYRAFIAVHSDEDAALTWLEERRLNSPRAWLINWYKQKSAAS